MEQVLNPTLEDTIHDLRAKVKGNVYLPGEEEIEAAVSAWNILVQHQPTIVVAATCEEDVQHALTYATSLDLPVGIQATGHGQFRTIDGGMLMNVRGLDTVEIEPETKTARIGGGVCWQRVIDAAAAHNLVPVSGSSPSVGVVGFTLGGGYGILSRKYGFGVDQVLSLRLIDFEGRLHYVSPTQEPDLYWAILGGGGSFGVVTEITIQLHDHPTIFGGAVMFDASLADQVYPAYLAFTKTAPEEVTSALTLMTYPPVPAIPEFLHGRSMLMFSSTAIGEEGEALLSTIRSLPGAEYDSFRPLPYTESHSVFNDPVDPLPATTRGVLLKDLDQEFLTKALTAVGPPAQSPNLLFRIRHLGGAMSRDGKFSNSIGRNREAGYMVYLIGIPMGPFTLDDMHAHAAGVFKSLEPSILSYGPLNWLGEGNVSRTEIAGTFSESELARQIRVKKSIDPHNRFRFAGVGLD